MVPFYSSWILGSHFLFLYILYQQKKGSLIVIWLLGYREPAVSDNYKPGSESFILFLQDIGSGPYAYTLGVLGNSCSYCL